MAESHIILLPRANYFEWVKATQKYAIAYQLNITPDPEKVGDKDVVTVAVPPNGYPRHGEILEWLRARYPDLKIDAIPVNFPEDLMVVLDDRVEKENRFGQAEPISSGETLTTVVPDRLYLFWPTDFPMVTQGFGAHPEIYSKYNLPGHEGLDFRAPFGSNVYACAEGEIYFVENDPDVHGYGKHIRIRHKNGFKTVYAHLSEVMVQVGQTVEPKELIGKADSTGNSTGSHLHLTLKKDGATNKRETNYKGDIIDPTPFMVYPHQEEAVLEKLNIRKGSSKAKTFPWVRPCLVGVNGRDDGTIQEADFLAIKTAKIEAVKVQENTPSNVVERLKQLIPNLCIMARIAYDLGQKKVTAKEWGKRMLPEIGRLYDLGIRFFEIHQSPNLQMYGWSYSWDTGREFGRWWMDIVDPLKEGFPEGRFGFPGVSPGGQVPGQRLDAKVFLEQADDAIQMADWVGVNCFWSNEDEMSAPDKGEFYKYVRERFPDKLLFITEFANVNDLVNTLAKGNQYVKYYRKLREEEGIGGAFAQVLSSPSGFGRMRWRNEDGKLTDIPYRVGEREF